MIELLDKYKNEKPEIVFEWHDKETPAKGWVVINSLKNGAAGGGTRMRKGLTKDEVISLAKVMEIKFSVSGPEIGGAKSGIDFDPNDPRREEVLRRWYKAIFPLLKNYYGTGGDLNVDEIKDVIPLTEGLGLWHPQEGIVNGHLDSERGSKVKILGQLRYGCTKIIEDERFVQDGKQKYAIADTVTGYGVAQSLLHYYRIFHKTELTDKKVIVQGWGNVASAAASYLAYYGAKIVGIIDKNGGLIKPEGYSLEEVKALYQEKKGNKLHTSNLLSFDEVNERIWQLEADIFIPGAASKLVKREQITSLMNNGLEVVACGANVPFVDDGIFFGPTATIVDEQISLIPDFIANCGMARVFAYLMQADADMTDVSIFSDVSNTIGRALEEIYESSSKLTHISNRALEIALNKIEKSSV